MERNFLNEKREQFSPRSAEVYMVRHGKQEKYEDPNSPLSAEGEEQARQFAFGFLEQHKDRNIIIKIKHSSVGRVASTAQVIEQTLTNEIESKGYKNVQLYNTQSPQGLKTTGSLGPLMKSGVRYEEVLDEWLENADNYPEARKPEEIADQIEKMIRSADKTIKRISSEGPDIIYIWVTHETSHAAMASRLTGKKNLEDLGGRIGHLEPIKISTDHNEATRPSIEFRTKKYYLDQEHNEE